MDNKIVEESQESIEKRKARNDIIGEIIKQTCSLLEMLMVLEKNKKISEYSIVVNNVKFWFNKAHGVLHINYSASPDTWGSDEHLVQHVLKKEIPQIHSNIFEELSKRQREKLQPWV